MNNRITELEMAINSITVKNQEDATQGDKYSHFLNIVFADGVELEGWSLLIYYKTMYPIDVYVDTFDFLLPEINAVIPNKALLRNGKITVEFALKKDEQYITVNKKLEIEIQSTINGTYADAIIAENLGNTISEQINRINDLIEQSENLMEDYNTNANTRLEEFNDSALQKGKEYVNAVKTEGDTWVIAIQHEGELQTQEVKNSGTKSIQDLNTEYHKKIDGLDKTITDYIVANNDKFKGEPGEGGATGAQGQPGLDGENGVNATITSATASVNNSVGTPSVEITLGGTESARTFDFSFQNIKGDKGDPGTTDYNELENKPSLDGYYVKNSLFQTIKADLAIQLKSNNNQAQYEEWVKNNVRKIIFGFESSNSNDKFVFNGYNNTFLELNGFTSITMRASYVDIGTDLRIGTGQSYANFSPDGNDTKSMRFFNKAIGENAYFNLESLGTMSLDTNNTNNRTYDISFKRNGNEKGQIGYSNGKMFLWNKTSQKTFEMLDNGSIKLPANNLQTQSKEIIGAINELKDRIDGITQPSYLSGSENLEEDYNSVIKLQGKIKELEAVIKELKSQVSPSIII